MQNSIHGGDVSAGKIEYDFSVNLNPLPIPKRVTDAMEKALINVNRYPDYTFGKLICALAKKHGLKEAQIAVGNGSSELFMAVSHAFSPGRILIPVPSFFGYEYAANAGNNEVVYYESDYRYADINPEDLKAELKRGYDLLFLANPNNPTGRLIKKEELFSLFDTCQKQDVKVVLDECFYELSEGTDSFFNDLNEYPNVIVVNSFTKTFSVPGVRIGYLACADEKLIKRIRKQLPEWNISCIAEAAGCACTECGDFLKESAEYIKKERIFLTEELSRLGIRVFDSDVNFILLYDERPLYDELLKNGILIRDASNFRGLRKGYYRIAVRSREENEKLIFVLRKIIRRLNVEPI